MFAAFTQSLALVLTPMGLLSILGGVLCGIFVGVMPGLSSVMGMSIMLPVALSLNGNLGVLMMLGIFCGAIYGGSITAIMINTPGTANSAATCLDGYPMAHKHHQPGRALSISTTASTFGGLFSAVMLLWTSPILSSFALKFSAQESFGTTRAKVNTKLERVLPSKSDLVTIFPTLIRSSLIGTLIGAIPGTGGDIASWVGYNEAKRWSKHPEQFGDGAPDGIAAPESANNAISGGALIPLLSLGIPGDACTAIMLGCLMMLGITPGPLLMTEQPAKVYMIIVGLFFANAFMALCGFAGIRIFTKISSVPSIVLTPLIFVFCFVGTFAVNHTVGDIYLMILCGILGFFLIKMEFSIPPIILGLILGGILEKNFRRAMVLSAGDWTTFFTRPISCVFIIIAFLSLIYPFVLAHLKQRKAAKKGEQA